MKKSDKEISTIICKSLINLWINQNEIIKRGVKEECINHKFCIYLESEIISSSIKYDGLSTDLEYNKNYDNPKSYVINGKSVKFRPDIIVHKRNSNQRNFIAFELKKGYPNKKDFQTLTQLLVKPYRYQYCFAIAYLPLKDYFKIYFVKKATEMYVAKLSKDSISKNLTLKWAKK